MPALIVDFALERVNVTRMVYKKNSFHALIVVIAVSLRLITHSWNLKTVPFIAEMLKIMFLYEFCLTRSHNRGWRP